MVDERPLQSQKGRGAVSNSAGRYEPHRRVAVDDGWDLGDDEDGGNEGGATKFRTEVTVERAKSALNTNTSPDVPFDRSLNPYRGCEHGCVYCYARPSHAFVNLSPGLDFESKLFAKTNIAEVLDRELRKPGYVPGTVMVGANTDAYQPIERTLTITRQVLTVLHAFRHPTALVTKSALIARDIDILADMAQDNLVTVGISLTTLDRHLARTLEPRAATPNKRLQTMRALTDAGVPVAVLAAPMIPTLNDHELEAILAASAAAGATRAHYVLLRLPLELKDLFSEWLHSHAPGKAKRVMNLLRQSRGGQLYVGDFATRMSGTGVHAKLLKQRFRVACQKQGLAQAQAPAFKLTTHLFRRPLRVGDQLSLL